MATCKITITVRLDEAVHEKLKTTAAKEVRSINNLIEYILTKYIEEDQSNNA